MIQTRTLVSGSLLLALTAGCVETAATGPQMPVDPSGPPFITTMSPDVSAAAISSCTSALDARTDGAVTAVGAETSQAATAVYLRVGPNGAPWRCLVSADGSNPSFLFLGNEGTA